MRPPVIIERLTVRRGSAEALTYVSSSVQRTAAAPGFADALIEALPGLRSHTCLAGGGRTLHIAEELADTETAHAVEHVALELLKVTAAPGERTGFAGHTAWGTDRYGTDRFRVRVEAPDDVRGTAALVLAVDIVNAVLLAGDAKEAATGALDALEGLRAIS